MPHRGYVKKDWTLADRECTCPTCGTWQGRIRTAGNRRPQCHRPPAGQEVALRGQKDFCLRAVLAPQGGGRKRASGEAPGQIVAQCCSKIPAEQPESLQAGIN